MKFNIYKNLMDLTQGTLMKMLSEKWEEISSLIADAKRSGETQVLIHKQEYPIDSCHKELRDRINKWLQQKDEDLYVKIYDDKFQGCFLATNPEVFVSWS